jgi:Uma2 family endonuclease
MTLQLETPVLAPETYLALERASELKHEYRNGEMIPMTGASRWHNLIVGNIYAALHHQLRKRPCEVYPSDMRVKASSTGLYTYPDIVVVCGAPLLEDDYKDTLLNPSVIVEVLSKSTEGYDRGEKFEHYRTLATLTDYILVAQDRVHVEHYQRREKGEWLFAEYKRLDQVVDIQSIHCTIELADVYEKVTALAAAEFETNGTH